MPPELPEHPVLGAVVTAFEPTDTVIAAVQSVAAQVDVVVVVDDGSRSPEALSILGSLSRPGVLVIRRPENGGIGAALNAGVTALDAWGCVDAVITVDQDSHLSEGYVGALVSALAAARRDGREVGMVGPASVGSIGHRPGAASARGDYAIGGEPIQSGLLIPRGVLRDLGGFREDLFIDGVDSDFYLRAVEHGLVAVIAPKARLDHRLGRSHRVAMVGRGFDLTVAADFRYYYQARNLVHLLRAHRRSAPRWCAGAVARQVRHMAIVSTLVPGRMRRLREYRSGLGDGLRGAAGRRPVKVDDDAGMLGAFAESTSAMVSVCMATWNGSAFVQEQVRSILEQLGPDDEVVIVDDASTDSTVDVVLAMDDPRIRVIRSPANRGYVRTFEHAIQESRGDVILLADQDDVWLPGRVRAMVDDLRHGDVVATNLSTLGGPAAIRGPFGQKDWKVQASTSGHRVRNTVRILAGDIPYFGCAMGLRRSAVVQGALPFPAFLGESHDLWLGLYGNLLGSMVHDERRTLARRYHDANATPDRPRGVMSALRSRLMLLRCIVELARRRVVAPRDPRGLLDWSSNRR